jgi:hypothetical protein
LEAHAKEQDEVIEKEVETGRKKDKEQEKATAKANQRTESITKKKVCFSQSGIDFWLFCFVCFFVSVFFCARMAWPGGAGRVCKKDLPDFEFFIPKTTGTKIGQPFLGWRYRMRV